MAKVKFHLPGLSFNYPLNMLLIDMMEKKPEFFRDVEIGSFFGEFPTSLWNGGRFAYGVQCPPDMVKMVVENINGKGIPIRYTYTNPMIFEEDLKDSYCNYTMQVADNGMNEVLVVSPLLEEYIRSTYPNYRVNSSTCKELKDIDALNAELSKDYYLVVLDQNMNHDFDFISRIENKNKIEILVNPGCREYCTVRREHYVQISAQQRVVLANRAICDGQDPDEVYSALPDYVKERLPKGSVNGKFDIDQSGHHIIPLPDWKCSRNNYATPYGAKGVNFISSEEIWEKYVPLGFTNFKLEGRTLNAITLTDYYVDYLVKPEYKDEARHSLLMGLNSNNIIGINMTWWQRKH